MKVRLAVGSTAACAALAFAVSGCGDGSSGGEEPVGALATAMSEASISADGVPSFIWVDTAQLREIGGLPPSTEGAIEESRWSTPVGIAFGEPIRSRFSAVDFGFDPLAGERTIAIGDAPEAATRYDGVDAVAVRSAFEEFGFTGDDELLAQGEEGELAPADDVESGPLNINRVAFEEDSVALSGYEESAEAALGRAGTPVIETDGFAAMAGCLGEGSFAARIGDYGELTAAEVSLAGVGLSGPEEGSDEVPEVICAAGVPDADLAAIADCMETTFNEGGVDPVTGQEFSGLLGEAEIEQGEVDGAPWVRATVNPPGSGERVGVVFSMYEAGALAEPLGGNALAAAGARVTPEIAEQLEQDQPPSCG